MDYLPTHMNDRKFQVQRAGAQHFSKHNGNDIYKLKKILMICPKVMATTSNFGLLLVGRFILGFAVALSAIAECIYIAEISTPEKRGKK